MKDPRFDIVLNADDRLVIRDVVHWDEHPTVTNAAEAVVERLAPHLNGRRLFYYDSEGRLDELLVKDGRFAGFAPAGEGEGGNQ